jgi:threonine dehydratase
VSSPPSPAPIDRIRVREAAARLEGVARRTPLVRFASGDPRVDLRLKLECEQETGSFKVRGAWNQICRLDATGRAAGVIATSSGNHGKALAWAARRAGVQATIVMPADAYPNKIQACRDLGAEVLLGRDRIHAEELCAERVASGATLVHPYDSERTIQGAGTVGLEIAEDWPEVEVVVFPVGGGGLIAGSSIALRAELGPRVRIVGAEPEGAPTLTLALEQGRPVPLREITTSVQGLCPLSAGELNTAVCLQTVQAMRALDDGTILAAQAVLVKRGGWTVEPAGAAAAAVVLDRHLPGEWLEGRSASNPLRVVAVISGGNPDPEQLESIRRRP